jgi:hypothetical protein
MKIQWCKSQADRFMADTSVHDCDFGSKQDAYPAQRVNKTHHHMNQHNASIYNESTHASVQHISTARQHNATHPQRIHTMHPHNAPTQRVSTAHQHSSSTQHVHAQNCSRGNRTGIQQWV